MITLRRSNERGHAHHGWLVSHHTFSFADYYDPAQMGFRSLRVINEDWVQPQKGFPTHPHRDMEIITYVIEGALAHKDSMGNGSIIYPGDVQRMSAGTGVTHSEYNASDNETVHLLQIWIQPKITGVRPSYEQKRFSEAEKQGTLLLIASPDGRNGSVTINQNAFMYATILQNEQNVEHYLAAGRGAYLHVVSGEIQLNGTNLIAGDGARIESGDIKLTTKSEGEALLFDLS